VREHVRFFEEALGPGTRFGIGEDLALSGIAIVDMERITGNASWLWCRRVRVLTRSPADREEVAQFGEEAWGEMITLQRGSGARE
jgi:hypothetical protein